MKPRPANLSDTELEVLKVLWDNGPGTVRQINDVLRSRGRRWAYTTVLTLLQRLLVKDCAASDKSDVAHVYRATASREKLLKQGLSQLADELCEGTATPLVHALVSGRRFTSEEIEQFRKLLDELEDKPGRAKPRR
jgi:predicted transcriptional regulator